jgi:large subunit ribosomal protein L30e
MDLKELKKILETEKAVFGFNETERLAGKKQIESVLIATNCPENLKAKLNEMKLSIENSDKSGEELAALCKKSFGISVLGIKK